MRGTKTSERIVHVAPLKKSWSISLVLPLLCAVASPVAAQAPSADYKLSPGDQIEVYVWGDERLQRAIRVLPDGSFTFPLVGRVVVSGLKTTDVEAMISKSLSSQYNGQPPQVTVSVQSPSGYSYSIIGRVKQPGSFTPMRYVNVLEALAAAGGPDEFANLDNVTIVRKSGSGLTSVRVRLGGVMKGSIPAAAAKEIPQIEVGDTVIVP
ncbi:MAG: polysaccharide biosynthesis/export family protein [Sphingobium sp.]|nr:polysaccharide biosynthesis/export family protein [Sphingobium sp.]